MINNKDVFPDPQTGFLPTQRQLEILLTLNPLEYDRTYEDVAKILKVSEGSIQKQISRLKQRCPDVYQRFKKLRKRNSCNLSLDFEINENELFIDRCYFAEDNEYIDTSKIDILGYFIGYGEDREFISFKIERIF